jgi:hypothetical protein
MLYTFTNIQHLVSDLAYHLLDLHIYNWSSSQNYYLIQGFGSQNITLTL